MQQMQLRCPDCQIVLTFEEGLPTERQECPACGALFQWDQATGIITHFYKAGEGRGTDLVATPADGGGDLADAVQSDRSPEEVIAGGREKSQQQAPVGQSGKPPIFRRTLIIVTVLLGSMYLGVASSDKTPLWREHLFVVFIATPLAGIIVASSVTMMGQSTKPMIFLRTFVIVTVLLGAFYLAVTFSDKPPLWREHLSLWSQHLFVVFVATPLVGLFVASSATITVDSSEEWHEFDKWMRHRRQYEPDIDEIAARLKADNIVRRPLPSDSSSGSTSQEKLPETAITATTQPNGTQNAPSPGEGVTEEIPTQPDTPIMPADSARGGGHPSVSDA
jgi:hypothetical protein